MTSPSCSRRRRWSVPATTWRGSGRRSTGRASGRASLTSWHNLSLYYGRFENIDSAVVYAYKVLQNISDENKIFSGYFYNIGDLYIGLGQYDSARYYLEKSLLFSPSLSMSYWSLAVMEAKLGNFKSAYHYLDTFVMVQDSLDASERLSEVQHIVYKNQTALEV